MSAIEVRRLVGGDRDAARDLFTLMAEVFGEDSEPLGDDYVDRLLGEDSFWVLGAFVGPDIVGGLTAHRLPMTRCMASEFFIYDPAVHPDYRRQGVGSRLLQELRSAAAQMDIGEVFVAADNEDEHALDFYRAEGAAGSPVTIFSFTTR
jgi:aminoglycoside 3-N-acetyltransferase I